MVLQNCDKSRIEVSKLCYPMCEQLLDILRDGKLGVFMVRGYNSTVSPVELPPWLPAAQVQEMVNRFRKLLLTEVSIFMNTVIGESTIRTKTHTHSSSTKSNVSFSSSGSESTASTPSLVHMRDTGLHVPWTYQKILH